MSGMISMVKRIPENLPGYLLLAGGYLALVWLLPFFPSQDGPSHIYNLAILHDLVNGGKEWGEAFSYSLTALPNLGFQLVAYPLLSLTSPVAAERGFISLYIILLLLIVPFYLRTFGKPPLPMSFLVFPMLFNFPLLMGFYSYSIGIPLFLLGFCLAWRVRDAGISLKVLSLNLAGGAIYCCHLIPFFMFVSSIVAIALTAEGSRGNRVLRVAREMLLIAPLLVLMLPHLLHSEAGGVPDLSYLLSLRRLVPLTTDLFSFSTVTFDRMQIFAAIPLMLLVLTAACAAAKNARREVRGGEQAPPGKKAVLCLALMLLCLYLLAPSRFGDGGFLNPRLPWVILIVLLPLLQLPESPFFKRFGSAALAGCAWFSLVANTVVLGEQSGEVKRFVAGMGAGMPKGSCILTFKKSARRTRVDPLLHASSYYALQNGCIDVGNYEAQVPYFPVRFKEGFPKPPPLEMIECAPSMIEWNRFPHIAYLLAWQASDSDTMPLRGNFQLFWSRDKLTLWKRKP